jgi:hypothetical protein
VLIVAAALFIAVRGGQIVGSYLRNDPAPAPKATATEATEAQVAQNAGPQSVEPTPQPPAIAVDPLPVATMTHTSSVTNTEDAAALDGTNPPQIVATVSLVEATIVGDRKDEVAANTAESADNLPATADVYEPGKQPHSIVAAPAEVETAEPPTIAASSRDVVVRVFAALSSGGAQRPSATTDDVQADARSSSIEPQNEGAAELNSLQRFAAQLARRSESPEESIDSSASPTADAARQALLQLFGGIDPLSNERPATAIIVESAVETGLPTDLDYAHEPAETLDQISAAAYGADSTDNLNGASTSEVQSDPQTAETATTNAMDAGSDTSESVTPTLNEPVDQSAASSTQDPTSNTGTRAEAIAELLLVNPPESAGPIRYLVNGHVFSMPPGHSHHLPAGREWRVKFHPGGDYDDVELSLRSGTYEFRATSAGWQLSVAQGDAASR